MGTWEGGWLVLGVGGVVGWWESEEGAYIIAVRKRSSIKAWTISFPAGLSSRGTFQSRISTVWSAVFLLLMCGTIFFFSYCSDHSTSSSSHCNPSTKPSFADRSFSYEMPIASPNDFQNVPIAHFSNASSVRHSYWSIHRIGSATNNDRVYSISSFEIFPLFWYPL